MTTLRTIFLLNNGQSGRKRGFVKAFTYNNVYGRLSGYLKVNLNQLNHNKYSILPKTLFVLNSCVDVLRQFDRTMLFKTQIFHAALPDNQP